MPRARTFIAAIIATACAIAAMAANAPARSLWNYTTHGAFSFVSAPKLHPSKISMKLKGKASQLARGAYFVAISPDLSAHQKMVGQSGAEILDRHGQPIWFMPVSRSVVANNLTVQTYNGQPALSYWQGVENSHGLITGGEDVVLDQHYKKIATLKGSGGWIVDLHEMVIDGTDAWVIASKNSRMDLRSHGGPRNGTFVDNAVQEYDLKTGNLLYTWDSKDHVALGDSYAKPNPEGVWDPYHMNSLQLTSGDTFLVSLRNTWAAYMIDRSTGSSEWTLGGKHSSFSFASKARFQWQHDVQLHSGNVVSVFDDHCCAVTKSGSFVNPSGPTRGLVLKLDLTARKASFVQQFLRGKHFNAAFLGDTDLQSNGNAVIGWGSQPFFSEFSKSGKMLLDADLHFPNVSYRAYKESWTGIPGYAPKIAVKTKSGRTTAYASWNGDTQVAKWRVLAGSSKLKAAATKSKNGFETAIKLSRSAKKYEVEALDRRGHVLGTSKVVSG
jgi:hypothetical protein